MEVTKETCHFIEHNGEEYIRFGKHAWWQLMSMSYESVWSYEELELEFQSWVSTQTSSSIKQWIRDGHGTVVGHVEIDGVPEPLYATPVGLATSDGTKYPLIAGN